MSDLSIEMPRYKCHKEVHALHIAKIERNNESDPNAETDGSAMLVPTNEKYAPIRVDHEFMRKHNPEVGGYYVVYDDGYVSFSPWKAFSEGYTLIT